MNKKPILRIALPTPLRRMFDYLPPGGVDVQNLSPGVRVKVPFQSRSLVGILQAVVDTPSVPVDKLKQATEVLDEVPVLTGEIEKLCHWAADYYHYSLGEVMAAALPVALRKGKDVSSKKKLPPVSDEPDTPPQLNAEQDEALQKITASLDKFKVFLLDGVTGSGKTEVYLQAIAANLAAGKQTLVLIPEISLTPQTINRFRKRFQVPIAALHSSLSDGERLRAWIAARSGEAKIVIGTRSAIFTPFVDLGLIIVDEEHDQSFKQQDRFRYHARDMAVMRANHNKIPIVLGSATPSLESLLNAERGRYEMLKLTIRAGGASMPTFNIIDVRRQRLDNGLSVQLVEAMKKQLAAGNQVMLFLNRRGFAPILFCGECGWIAECKRCDAKLVYHRSPLQLRCHHCDARMSIPKKCPECSDTQIQPVGIGTQRLEDTLLAEFADTEIIRVDRDTTSRKNSLHELLDKVNQDKPAILLGTQMLAKGHHFPQVTLVAVLDADAGLFSADFRAAEQMGQLLMQVSGRAGRAEKEGMVMIQTRFPDHPHFQQLIEQGYPAFAHALLKEREEFLLPPYSYSAVFRAESYSETIAANFLDQLKDLSRSVTESISLMGPVPALMAKKKGMHCQHLVVKADNRGLLQKYLASVLQKLEDMPGKQKVKWVLDVDPIEGV